MITLSDKQDENRDEKTYVREFNSSKVMYYEDRIRKWQAGERISPVTVDMALTRACNYRCTYCYGQLQENGTSTGVDTNVDTSVDTSVDVDKLTWPHLQSFLEDCARLGVRGVSMVSDGESTCHPDYVKFIIYGKMLGLDMALGTNGYLLTSQDLTSIVPHLTYLRFNISSGLPYDYARVHGVRPRHFYRVCGNILDSIAIRNKYKSSCTIGMQMVLTPNEGESIRSLTLLALDLGVDYLVIKHCSDDEDGSLGIDYSRYESLIPTLGWAEKQSNDKTRIVIKWSKILEGNKRAYKECYGPPFHIQLSGSGLVAPCGMLFNDKYSKYHIGNIKTQGFYDIVKGDRYWEVMNLLRGSEFDARTMCGCLCLQHETNKYLIDVVGGRDIGRDVGIACPKHISFL